MINFDDGHAGSYVDYNYAQIIPPTQPTAHAVDIDTDDWVTAAPDNNTRDEDLLVTLMDRLAIQTAVGALAEANNMVDAERVIEEQAEWIRTQARHILC